MLECLEGYKTKITDPVAVELAVFFHDWVYEPQGKANEAESAVAFAHFAAELGIEEELKQKIIVMIDATVGHGVGEDIPVRQRDDLELFLDFDLEVLGRDWEDYMAYAKKIRMEYICFEEQDYNMGRAKVLRTFLDRKRVYFSESFYTKKEETARQNMQREIELLESGGV
jgi:predicted metal-dependent HD superfamily phosphohydrolase